MAHHNENFVHVVSVKDIEPMKALLVCLGSWATEATERDHKTQAEKALLKQVEKIIEDTDHG